MNVVCGADTKKVRANAAARFSSWNEKMHILKDIKLHQNIDGGQNLLLEGCGSTIIEFAGLTKFARLALSNKPLTVLYFPFRIGRLSRTDLATSVKQDLLIPDTQPYSISRQHISFEKDNEKIVLVDMESRCGTTVDNVAIGRNCKGVSRVELGMGLHTIALGGSDSPFLFQASVRTMRPADSLSLDNDLPDRLPQARMLYAKLCQYEQNLLNNRELSPQERGMAAEGMVRVIVSRPDLLELLQRLASNPVSSGDYLAQHSVNVAIYAIVLFKNLQYQADEMVKIASAALLHDIGMQHIDHAVFLKNSALSREESNIVRKHTELGGEMLECSDEVCTIAAVIARDHHERIDRSGYPRGINMLSEVTRFVGLLDCFEAITHDRPQRKAFSPHEAMRILAANNTAFDPDTRKAFVNVFSFYPVSTMVRLDTGEIGQVVRVNQGRPLTPQIRILTAADGTPDPQRRLVDLSAQ